MKVTHVGPYAGSADIEATTKVFDDLAEHVGRLRIDNADEIVLNALISTWINLSLLSFGTEQTRKSINDLPGCFEEGLLSLKDLEET
jgi:hypothetical protein